MKVKIIKEKTPEELEEAVNAYISNDEKVINVSYAIGAFPGFGEFSAMILFKS